MSSQESEGAVRALIIEDEPAIALGLADDLEAAGWTTRHASEGVQALRALTDARFDLAVIDLGLRDGSGANLVHCIQQAAPTMRLVIYTGCVAYDPRRQGLPIGIPVVEKPCSSNQFMQAIQATWADAHLQ